MNCNKNDTVKLPDGWVLCTSKSNPGRKYYFNRKTGKSSWTQPKAEEKPVKRNVKQKGKREKAVTAAEKKKEEAQKKCVKRKSSGEQSSPVKKRNKQEIPEKHKAVTPKKIVTVQQIAGSLKKKANEVITKTSPHQLTSPRKSLTKNIASNRLSLLQDQLQAEVEAQKEEKVSPQNRNRQRISPATSESPAKIAKLDKSPIQNELRSATIQSPTNDSVQSTPSPSQFLTANKIISSMKAQLPEEYNDKSKLKSTFASIEEGICNQTTEYPYMKHPGTPPQFSEANKLVSAIKSKLSYRAPPPKDVSVLTFTSANDRLQTLRSRLSDEALNEITDQDYLNKIVLPVEKMDVEECRETKQNVSSMQVTNEAVNIKDNVVLVVDTNIFIYELDVIKNVLNSHIRGYTQQPTLLVPWRVINELDRLKDNNNGNGAICKPARCAMDYLYKSLPENDRIKGQSLRDANSHIYPCESPDDEILNCCLQQAERGKSVILLSNDKNLCNKANINGVKCIGLAELKPLLENRPEPSADPDLYESVKHYEDTMYRLLSNILENEMRAKYNNLWQHVLFKPPPWNFLDVVSCLLKHWIAVFNEVFPRIEHLFSDLKSTFTSIQRKGPDSLGQSEVSTFKELCLEIAKKCQIIPEYMELAKATVERLQKKREDTSSSSNGGELMVISAFEGLWTVFSSYCSKLSSALGIPHSLDDKLPGSDTLEDLSSKWSDFSGQLRELTFAIKNSFSIDNSDPNSQQLNYFEAVFRKSLKLLSLDDTGITHENIRIFCFNCKNMLREAHAKFTELVELLDVCRNNISNM